MVNMLNIYFISNEIWVSVGKEVVEEVVGELFWNFIVFVLLGYGVKIGRNKISFIEIVILRLVFFLMWYILR